MEAGTIITLALAVVGLAGAIFAHIGSKKKEKKDELNKIDEKRKETRDPSLAALRRLQWWMRNNRS